MNKRQAAIQAGYAPATANIVAKKITDKLASNRHFIEEAHRQGLTVEAIIGELKRGVTEAMNPQHPDQPDNFNRRYYTDMAIRLFGAYAPTRMDIEVDKREIIVHITPETIEKIAQCQQLMGQDEADCGDDECPF
ncbi:MAG: hypothetical protein SCM96_13560 [Acidobacteriota bacterium]|nr:hypothetical protein [Acidobacteriota bacterium]